jgi:hypothetical protein
MPDIIRTVKRHRLLFSVGLIVIAVLVAVILYMPRSVDKMVASGVVSISANSATYSFSYSGASVNQSMSVGCTLPASMKITCQSLNHTGIITVYINDKSYATGTAANTGEVVLSSGCGCSTVCICEIRVGENTIRVSSDNFAGQLKYEIYVKT